MSSIPASQIVTVNPNVLSAGGRALDIVGVILTTSTRVPVGTVQSFATASDVGSYFGLSSTEYALAVVYFNGFDNSNVKPSRVYFVQYYETAVPAYLRGGTLSGMTLTELQALAAGTLTLTIDGVVTQAASVDLSTATSFSDAASKIQADFLTTMEATPSASCTGGTISGTTLTVDATSTGAWTPGMTVTGASVTAGSYIVAQLAGGTPKGAGTYELSASSTVAVGEAVTAGYVPAVTYDSTTGAFLFTMQLAAATETITYVATNVLASALKLTSVTGAVISQGAGAASALTFMTNVTDVTTDWATFMTAFDPDVSGNDNKLAFAEWANGQKDRYAYVCWDTDDSAATTTPATGSLGYLIGPNGNNYSGTFLIGSDGVLTVDASYAAFACGTGAAIDFTQHNGRITFAFKSQSGLAATCANASAAENLISNGYNFYGAYATANDQFVWMYPGSVSGKFLWMDSYVNEIWLNNQLQLAIMVLFQNTKSIPYNQAGYALIEAACLDPILQGLNFGAFRAGVTLSAAQAAEVNSAARRNIDKILSQQGWYLQVLDALPQVRAARGSPPCNFWYLDGQSVQKISLASINVQ